MTSCSTPLNKQQHLHLSQKDFEEIISFIPDVPKRDEFTLEEQKKIAEMPYLLKEWVFQMVMLTKCAKENKCG